MKKTTLKNSFSLLAIFFTALLAGGGCTSWESVPDPTKDAKANFEPSSRSSASFSSDEVVQAFRSDTDLNNYRLWDGDHIQVDVLGRPELSGQHIIGPDGKVTLPVYGIMYVRGQTREEAARSVVTALKHYYKDVYATIRVEQYSSNRVIVLGRVEHPGSLPFEYPPLLLEILAKAGGLPLLRPEQVLTRCAIIRGDRILWIDIKRLLGGDMGLNIQLARNDTVYIPDSTDTSVYVLGAVNHPGVFRLTPQMSFMDALSQAGGPTPDANLASLHLIRPSKNANLQIDMESILNPDSKLIPSMEVGDIVYVARSWEAKVGYVIQKLNPFASMMAVKAMGAF